jgi:GNAT superfamily N-acetyltransferase
MNLRPATSDDVPFIESVYFETQRWIIESLFGWRGDDVEREKFCKTYDSTNTHIIVVDGKDAGWLTVRRAQDHITLDSIYLSQKWQGAGLGTHLIEDIIREAGATDVPLRLSTAKINRARNLYERLGFAVIAEDTYKVYLEHRSEARTSE